MGKRDFKRMEPGSFIDMCYQDMRDEERAKAIQKRREEFKVEVSKISRIEEKFKLY